MQADRDGTVFPGPEGGAAGGTVHAPSARGSDEPMSIFLDSVRPSQIDLTIAVLMENQAPFFALIDSLAAEARLGGCVVTRPHPLLGVVRKEQMFVLVAQASVWDRAREVLRP